MNRQVATDPTLVVNRDRGVRPSARLSVLGVLFVAVAAAAVVTTPVGAAAKSARGSAAGATQVHHFAPFAKNGSVKPGYKVTARLKGYCWTTSDASSRADAFRCVRVNQLFDPCFSNPAKTKVACAVSVLPKEIVLLKLTRSLPQPNKIRIAQAFVLVIHGKHACGLDTGATFAWHGRRANYGCPGGEWLFGHADRHGRTWKIREGRGLHPHIKWVSIVAAWF